MPPPLTIKQTQLMNKVFYEDNVMFGRDKMYLFLKDHFPEYRISRPQVMAFLKSQEIHQIHMRPTEPKTIRATVSKLPHNTIGMDLFDMQNFESNGYKYVLNCIDLFSRYLYAVPLKNKTDKEVLKGFKYLYNFQIKDIKNIRSDNGSEFIAKIFKDYLKKKEIKQILTEPAHPQSNGVIERANGVLKTLIKKSLDADPDFEWAENLNKLVSNINNTINFGSDRVPADIEKQYRAGNTAAITEAYDRQKNLKKNAVATQRFKKNDQVRIRVEDDKDKGQFWSIKLYKVTQVYKPKTDYGVYLYKVDNYQTLFKQEELQLVEDVQHRIENTEKYRVSKIIRPSTKFNKPHYEVRWVNHNEPTIEPRSALIKDIPKMINQYENKHYVCWNKIKSGRLQVSFRKDE